MTFPECDTPYFSTEAYKCKFLEHVFANVYHSFDFLAEFCDHLVSQVTIFIAFCPSM